MLEFSSINDLMQVIGCLSMHHIDGALANSCGCLYFDRMNSLRETSQRASWTEKLLNPPRPSNNSTIARNLAKNDVGGVIFGCKNNTMMECLSKQLFGMLLYLYLNLYDYFC